MKLRAIFLVPLILGIVLPALARNDSKDRPSQRVERTIAVDPAVTISLCVTSANVSVSGWDKNEVFARSDASQIHVKGGGKRLELSLLEDEGPRARVACYGYSDVELRVPLNATVHIQTRDGNISIADVTAAYAGTQNGDISLLRVVKWVEAATIGGSIAAKDSGGRISLTSIGGGIDVTNVRPLDIADAFAATSVSGDIILTQVGHSRFNVKSVSGNVNLTGPLASGGRYGFLTMSGDVTLALPENSSFALSAKVSREAVVTSDFALEYLTEDFREATAPDVTPAPAPTPPGAPKTVIKVKPGTAVKVNPKPTVIVLRQVNAVHGAGEANISVSSFSGKVLLQKKKTQD